MDAGLQILAAAGCSPDCAANDLGDIAKIPPPANSKGQLIILFPTIGEGGNSMPSNAGYEKW